MNNLISRDLEPHLKALATSFRVLAVLGPRQSGKTTLARKVFPNYAYISCENSEIAELIKTDPQRFFSIYTANAQGIIIDEFQKVPSLLSALQTVVDLNPRPGFFILTGSQNYLMNKAISQSLAGRVGILTLLPLSLAELKNAGALPASVDTVMARGLYPDVALHAEHYSTKLDSYLTTYVERDVRDLTQVGDLHQFRIFMRLCAGRAGQLINFTSLANDCGISTKTAQSWLSILEAAYIVFSLTPHYENFSKRLVKSKKLYFYDPGIMCSLIGITHESLATHPLRGQVFETLIISELAKARLNNAQQPNLYFWRDKTGHEVDCIYEPSYGRVVPIEIKSAQTLNSSFTRGLEYYSGLLPAELPHKWVVYGGNERMPLKDSIALPWHEAAHIISEAQSLASFPLLNAE